MKDKARPVPAAFVAGLLAGSVLWAWAAAEDAKDPGSKPDKKVTQPATQPAKKPAPKPPVKPPKKKDDFGIAPDDPWRESQAGRIELSGYALGPPLEPADLKGQVLLVANWDGNRDKTKKLLPGLVRLDSQYRRRGLVLIGARKYSRDKGRVISTARQFGVKFTVYGSVFVPDTNFDKFMKLKAPYCYVLDHTGKVIFEDRPGGRMMSAIQSALRRRPHPVLGDAKYPKSVAILSKVRVGKLGEAITLCGKAKEKGGQAGEEAAALLTSLERNAKRLLAKADRTRKKYPIYALETLTLVKKEYAGSAFGEQAEAKLKELSEDEALQNEIRAEKECRAMVQALGAVPRFPYDRKRTEQNRWIRRYGPTLKAAKTKIARLSKKYADTRAFKEAEALFNEVMPTKPEK